MIGEPTSPATAGGGRHRYQSSGPVVDTPSTVRYRRRRRRRVSSTSGSIPPGTVTTETPQTDARGPLAPAADDDDDTNSESKLGPSLLQFVADVIESLENAAAADIHLSIDDEDGEKDEEDERIMNPRQHGDIGDKVSLFVISECREAEVLSFLSGSCGLPLNDDNASHVRSKDMLDQDIVRLPRSALYLIGLRVIGSHILYGIQMLLLIWHVVSNASLGSVIHSFFLL